ncbi:MAG: heme-copper oxidase subunit III [Acidobacteria bacterium]|nr:heme-copper oxidase subunit III [Acidobacteriota bacterium]
MTDVTQNTRVLDLSELPATVFDTRSILWWGNLLLLFIETAMFGILLAIYFTVMSNTDPFPPPRIERMPVLYDSSPTLTLPIVCLGLLLISLVPCILLDISARRRNPSGVKLNLILTLVITIAAIIVRYYEFDSLNFKWDDNAYGSITWMLLGMHMLHMIALGSEDLFLLYWTFGKELDDKHALDLTVTAVYWYWIVGIWIVLFPIIYILPRFMH